MFVDAAMEGIESVERQIQCSDWKEHVGKILVTQSNNMFKELMGDQMPWMLALLNTLIQHEATQATRKKPVELDADGLPIPFVSTKHGGINHR